MSIEQITTDFSITAQIQAADIAQLKDQGFRTIICNRPDSEDGAVPAATIAAKAKELGLTFHHLPVVSTAITQDDVAAMAGLLENATPPVLAYCRSGARSTRLYEMAGQLAAAQSEAKQAKSAQASGHAAKVVIIGGGAAGISVASSLLERDASIQITIIDPADVHYYQPGWTMVGAGVFAPEQTTRTMARPIRPSLR